MKSIILSCTPTECEKLVNGDMSILVRKKVPNESNLPIKAYIYETKGATETPWVDEDGHYIYKGKGQVIGEFVCNEVEEFHEWELSPQGKFADFERERLENFLTAACLSEEEVVRYRENLPYFKPLYGLHISDLKIYDEPKALSCFYKQCPKNTTCSTCDWLHVDWHTFGECSNTVTRPPQNYIYVEEQENSNE